MSDGKLPEAGYARRHVLLAIILGNGSLLLVGAFFTAVAGGDFLVLWPLRAVPGDALVEDHPSRAGCVVTF